MKTKSRLKSVRRKQLRRKIVFTTFLLLLALYIISKIETLNPVRALAPSQFDVVYVEKQVEVIKEVEVDRTFDSEKQQILGYIVEVFGDDSVDAINVVYCENRGLRPDAENWNSNGTWDAGIFQVNQIHGQSMEDMKDWKKNIDFAYKLFKRGGWSQWSCSHRIGVTPFYLKGAN